MATNERKQSELCSSAYVIGSLWPGGEETTCLENGGRLGGMGMSSPLPNDLGSCLPLSWYGFIFMGRLGGEHPSQTSGSCMAQGSWDIFSQIRPSVSKGQTHHLSSMHWHFKWLPEFFSNIFQNFSATFSVLVPDSAFVSFYSETTSFFCFVLVIMQIFLTTSLWKLHLVVFFFLF